MELSSATVSAILERFSDEGIITDWCSTYGEPGYDITGSAETVTGCVVLGDYWCRCGKVLYGPDHPRAGEPELHSHEQHRPHLWEQLAAQGVQFEWYDEWIIDHESDKAYRTSGDSYSWQPSFVLTDDCELLTPDDDIDAWIEWAANNSGRCIPGRVYTGADLIAEGFEQYNGKFENGWHPGMDDDPEAVTAAIRRDHEDVDVVFALDETSQFYVTFSAYYRPNEDS